LMPLTTSVATQNEAARATQRTNNFMERSLVLLDVFAL
jgi:hypothetical protein